MPDAVGLLPPPSLGVPLALQRKPFSTRVVSLYDYMAITFLRTELRYSLLVALPD